MNKHEELIRKIAEAMVRDRYGHGFDAQSPEGQEYDICAFTPVAIKVVKRMAEVVRYALIYAGWTFDNTTQYLEDKGLIPVREGGQDE